MIRRKNKGRNDAKEGRRISTRGGEREKMQEEEEELQTMDKQTLLGRFANRSDETNLNYVHIRYFFSFSWGEGEVQKYWGVFHLFQNPSITNFN